MPPNGSNCGVGRPRRLPDHVEAELISREILNDMRFLPLRRRVELIRREHGIEIGASGLGKMYRRHGVKYLQAKVVKRLGNAHEARLEQQRIAFARKLSSLQEQRRGDRIIYMDETTFQIWPKPSRTW